MAFLTREFYYRLVTEFPFLEGWNHFHTFDEKEDTGVEVEFKVERMLDPKTVWHLEYGRRNGQPDSNFTRGITWVGISDGTSLEWIKLQEGYKHPRDVLRDDTKFVIVRYTYRSQLVYCFPEYTEYTLHKRGEETVAALKAEAERDKGRIV